MAFAGGVLNQDHFTGGDDPRLALACGDLPASGEGGDVLPTRRRAADHKAVARAVDIILNAENPLVLAGTGAVRKRAS